MRLGQAWRAGTCQETVLTVHNNKFMPRQVIPAIDTFLLDYSSNFNRNVTNEPVFWIKMYRIEFGSGFRGMLPISFEEEGIKRELAFYSASL